MVLLLATSMLFAAVAFSNSTDSVNNGGNSGTGNGYGGSESVVTKDDFVGTWTGTLGPVSFSITLNTDGTLVEYQDDEGFTAGNWKVTNSDMTANISGVGPFNGRLENDKIDANYMNYKLVFTKVNTTAYVGTWTGTMEGDVSLSVTLKADGTISVNNSSEGYTTGLWTVINSNVIMWLDIENECPEFGLDGNLQNCKLVVNFMDDEISLTKK